MLATTNEVRVRIPEVFEPFWKPARFKATYGGRGSAKSWTIATIMIINAMNQRKRYLCCREIQRSIEESVKELLEQRIHEMGASYLWNITNQKMEGPHGSRFNFAGLRSNVASIKSMEDLDGAFVEEAHTVSQKSIEVLEPTIRNEGSEIFYAWNPDTEFDPVDQKFRDPSRPIDDAIIIPVSYKDNPWFPEVLRKDMERDYANDPEKADHVWGGGYQRASKHAYFARLLARAQQQGQITNVPVDPVLPVHVAWDLGKGQNMALWFFQFHAKSISALEFLQGDDEAAAEGLPWYIRELNARPYHYGKMILPHDAKAPDSAFGGKSREAALIDAGFQTEIMSAMNAGDEIDLVKRHIPMTYFDKVKTADGLKALRAYRENWDEENKRSKGPLHNWASHPSQAFRHGCQAYEAPRKPQSQGNKLKVAPSSTAWMG